MFISAYYRPLETRKYTLSLALGVGVLYQARSTRIDRGRQSKKPRLRDRGTSYNRFPAINAV